VHCPSGSGTLPIEDVIAPLIARGHPGVILLSGPAGCGKTTALRHLAAVLPGSENVVLLDEPGRDVAGFDKFIKRLVVATEREQPAEGEDGAAPSARSFAPAMDLALAFWTDDEAIEYCRAGFPGRCGDVMRRFCALPDRETLGAAPFLWRLVLDALAADEPVASVDDAILRALRRHLADESHYRRALQWLRAGLIAEGPLPEPFGLIERSADPASELLRHRRARTLLLADEAFQRLERGKCPEIPLRVTEGDVIRAAGALIRQSPAALHTLRGAVRRHQTATTTVISLAVASGDDWAPRSRRRVRLADAYLRGAKWAGAKLKRAVLWNADLRDADLREAVLEHAQLTGANLQRANLSHALANDVSAREARFADADMRMIRADRARLGDADLRGARLEGASLVEAEISGDVTGADFSRADLTGAFLLLLDPVDANFSGAKLDDIASARLDLRPARLDGASFVGATLTACNLAGCWIRGVNFERADLSEALLTGSRIPLGRFRGSILHGAGLAGIAWEGADLRDVDFTNASFHLGSSRSGRLDSPIACEGSRTGFYSDEYYDMSYRPPEEVRVANLRGADLRGALVEGTDFYLVDLRGAKYDADQAEHFRRCGAILPARV